MGMIGMMWACDVGNHGDKRIKVRTDSERASGTVDGLVMVTDILGLGLRLIRGRKATTEMIDVRLFDHRLCWSALFSGSILDNHVGMVTETVLLKLSLMDDRAQLRVEGGSHQLVHSTNDSLPFIWGIFQLNYRIFILGKFSKCVVCLRTWLFLVNGMRMGRFMVLGDSLNWKMLVNCWKRWMIVASFFGDQGYLISFWLTILFHDFDWKNLFKGGVRGLVIFREGIGTLNIRSTLQEPFNLLVLKKNGI